MLGEHLTDTWVDLIYLATEFNAQRDNVFADKDALAHVRLGFFAHELRNHLNSAVLALAAITKRLRSGSGLLARL